MKKSAITLIGWVVITPILAEEVDFSKAYVMPSATAKELRVGGIAVHNGNETLINWVSLNFNAETRTFNVKEAMPQVSDAELLEQRLRGTVWSGTYKSPSNLYLTELTFKIVQNGFITGEMVHQTADPEATNLLRVEVAGKIFTQYFLDVKGNGELVWVNESELKYGVPPPPSNVRQVIRLKRIRSIEHRHTTSSWGSQSEYWMTLENNRLVGSVGTPPDRYGGSEELTNPGVIDLEEVLPPVTAPAPILLPVVE